VCFLSQVAALAPYAGGISLVTIVAFISYLSLILGELVPKRLALQNAEGVASTVASVMGLVAKIAGPVVSVLSFSTEVVLRVLRRHNVEETSVSLYSLVIVLLGVMVPPPFSVYHESAILYLNICRLHFFGEAHPPLHL
jgi:putative hemolysin